MVASNEQQSDILSDAPNTTNIPLSLTFLTFCHVFQALSNISKRSGSAGRSSMPRHVPSMCFLIGMVGLGYTLEITNVCKHGANVAIESQMISEGPTKKQCSKTFMFILHWGLSHTIVRVYSNIIVTRSRD